eukprot:6177935-Pleurochrysis_carterae.AAC.1
MASGGKPPANATGGSHVLKPSPPTLTPCYASVAASHRLTVKKHRQRNARRIHWICAGGGWPMRPASFGSTLSVACCSLRAVHAPAPVQAPCSGALTILPLPARCSRFRLPPLACSRIAPRGLRTKEFPPPRATNRR